MDSTKAMDDSLADGKEVDAKADQVHKTPVRPGKGVKRKHQSPAIPSGKQPDEEKPGSAKKRRKSASGTPLSRVASPVTTPFKPAMTERQQMALLLQMTDPNKQHPGGDETPPSSVGFDSTPKSRLSRKNERGETPLHLACIKGDLKTATTLVNQGAGVNEVDNAGWTPLHEACNYGHNKLVVFLLKHGAKVNARGMDGDSPLHDAAGNSHVEVVKTLLAHGSDPHQTNDKGLTAADSCKDPAILKILGEAAGMKEEETGKEREEGGVREAGAGENLSGAEEEGDEDVFEAKPVTVSDAPSTGQSLKSMAAQQEGDKDDHPCEEDHLPSTKETPSKEHHTSPSTVESARDTTGSGTTLTKLIGKATPFFSDISSSESESELPEIKLTHTLKKHSPTPIQREEEGEGENEDGKMETSSQEFVDEKEEESPSTKEEAKVKISHKDQGLDTSARSPLATDLDVEKSSHTLPDQNQSDEQQASTVGALSSDALSLGDSHPASPKNAESAEIAPTPSAEADISAEGQFKGQFSPSVTSPVAKSSQSLSTCSETTGVSGSIERELYVVSIPLSLVRVSRVSRKSKSRSNSKEFGDSGSVHSHTAVGDMKVDMSGEEESGKDKQSVAGKEMHVHVPSMLLTRSESKSDIVEHLRLSSSKSVERRDSTSSQDSRSSTSGERKHSRKPQHVYSSKKLFKESKRDDERGRGVGDDVTDSFSISVEFGVLPSQQSKLMRHSSVSSPTSLTVTSSSPGLSVRSQGKITVEDSASVLLRSSSVGGARDGYDDVKTDRGDDSKSTVISFSTSLPIQFSSQQSVATSQSRTTHSKDVLATPPSIRTKAFPMLTDSVKPSASAPVTPLRRERSGPHHQGQESTVRGEQDILSLPPKKRFRAVQRSSVIQQRRTRPHLPVSNPPHFSSFLMCSGHYHSKQLLQPTNPKTVYPPLHSAMYKLFSEQENERVRLATSHLTEQDRIVLSMEQELLRAYQRASKSPNPLSVCSVLLEQLLPKTVCELSGELPDQGGGACANSVSAMDSKTMSPIETSKENGTANDPLDVRLLTGLVQDVWDKFFHLKESVLIRQRHEAEALWLVQQELWRQRRSELGFVRSCSLEGVAPTHVPLANYITRSVLVDRLL